MRRFAAALSVVAVLFAPLAALWCAYTCAIDDAVVVHSEDVASTAPLTAASSDLVVASQDDCPSGMLSAAVLAIAPAPSMHAGSGSFASLAGVLETPPTIASAHRPAGPVSRGSAPLVSSAAVLRI
jgi:hypothetical protein